MHFSVAFAHTDTPSTCRRVPFLHILTHTDICCLFYDRHSDRCEVVSGCGFDLHVSDDQR